MGKRAPRQHARNRGRSRLSDAASPGAAAAAARRVTERSISARRTTSCTRDCREIGPPPSWDGR